VPHGQIKRLQVKIALCARGDLGQIGPAHLRSPAKRLL